MGIFLALDYGEKRTGIAVTDINKIIASGLTALSTKEVIPYLIKGDIKGFISSATICSSGSLTQGFEYLSDYINSR